MGGRVAMRVWYACLLVLYAQAALAQPPVPSSYYAVTNRNVYPKPAAPTLGPAGHRLVDPPLVVRLSHTILHARKVADGLDGGNGGPVSRPPRMA